MINQSNSYTPSYAQPHAAASLYANTLPFTYAAGSALFTPGNRVDKTKSGVSSLTYWLGFEQMDRLYQKGLRHYYEKHPKVADTINQNPVLLGIPLMMIGLVPDIIAATAIQKGTDMALNHPKVHGLIHRGLYSDAGHAVADKLRPFEKKANTPIVKKILAFTVVGLGLYFVIRAFLDAKHFGQDYRQAKKQNPNASPYALEASMMNQNSSQG